MIDPSGEGARPEPLARSVRGDAAALFAGKIGSNLALTALAITTARSLGPSGRGAIVLVVTTVTVTTLLSAAGTSVVLRTRLAAGQRDDLGPFLGLACVLMGIQTAITATAALTVLSATDVQIHPLDVVIVAGLGAVSVSVWLLLDVLYGLGRHREVAVIDFVSCCTQLAFFLGGRILVGASVRLALAAIMVGWALETALLARYLGGARPEIDGARWRGMLRAGLAPMRQSLAELAVYRADRIVLGLVRTTREVGIYSIAATTAELLRLLPLAVGQVLAPRVASGSTRIEDVRRYRAFVLGVMASGALVMTAAASTLIPALVGERFRGAVALLGIMALAETILASYVVDVHVMQGQGRFHAASLASTVCGPLIVLLDVVLIASNGPRGAAWATVIGYSAMAVIGHTMLRRGTTTGSPVRS